MPKGNRLARIPVRNGMNLRMTSRRCLVSVTTTTRARSGRATTAPMKNWDGACGREPETNPTWLLAGGLASHLLLT